MKDDIERTRSMKDITVLWKFIKFWNRMDKIFGYELSREDAEKWADVLGVGVPEIGKVRKEEKHENS